VTNLHPWPSQSTTWCPTTWISYGDHRVMWLHFTLFIDVRHRNRFVIEHFKDSQADFIDHFSCPSREIGPMCVSASVG